MPDRTELVLEWWHSLDAADRADARGLTAALEPNEALAHAHATGSVCPRGLGPPAV